MLADHCSTEASGKKYMMMETVIYSREYLFVKELRDTGKLGKIQFLRAATNRICTDGQAIGRPSAHALCYPCCKPLPCNGCAMAEYVSCFGSGKIADPLIPKYGSPFAVETAHIKLKGSDLSAEVTRSLFDVARQYIESFDVYGSEMSFEWQLVSNEEPVVHLGGEDAKHAAIKDYAHLLPEGIREFTTKCVYDMAENKHLSFIQGSGHGGSHPHLANEFISAIVEDRDPFRMCLNPRTGLR